MATGPWPDGQGPWPGGHGPGAMARGRGPGPWPAGDLVSRSEGFARTAYFFPGCAKERGFDTGKFRTVFFFFFFFLFFFFAGPFCFIPAPNKAPRKKTKKTKK